MFVRCVEQRRSHSRAAGYAQALKQKDCYYYYNFYYFYIKVMFTHSYSENSHERANENNMLHNV